MQGKSRPPISAGGFFMALENLDQSSVGRFAGVAVNRLLRPLAMNWEPIA